MIEFSDPDAVDRVIVVGAGGFLGREFCRIISSYRPVLACDSPERLSKLCNLDINSFEYNFGTDSPADIPCKPKDAAVIFSWRGYPAEHEKSPTKYLSTNLESTLALIRSLIKQGISRIAYASSGSVYPNCNTSVATEETKVEPIGYYGIGKVVAEMYVRKEAIESRTPYAILRIGNAYGPGQLEDNLSVGFIARAVKSALKGEKIDVWGPDDIFRDYIHAEDIARAFAHVLLSEKPIQGTFNVGFGASYSNRQVLELVECVLKKRLIVEEHSARDFDVREIRLSIDKIQSATQWSPRMPIVQGINQLATIVTAIER